MDIKGVDLRTKNKYRIWNGNKQGGGIVYTYHRRHVLSLINWNYIYIDPYAFRSIQNHREKQQ